MTQITYSGLTPLAPENVNDLNTKLLEVKTVVNGNLDSGNLAANAVGTSELQDGSVTAAKLASAVGAPLAVTSQLAVGNTGQSASGLYPGRILAPADFTGLGLSAPAGLYNLSSTADSSGNGRTLTNKGGVTFDTGITGSASTAALFTGSTAQALYIASAVDALGPRTGSFGAWCRCAKRGTGQVITAKSNNAATAAGTDWVLGITSGNFLYGQVSDGTTLTTITGATDICDDRWHYVVLVADGTLARLYVDGVLDAIAPATFLQTTAVPFNIGAQGTEAAVTGINPHFGRIDETFVTPDVLSEDEVHFLYCSKIAHAYPSAPKQSWLQVRRTRRGADWATTDFPSTPSRLYAGGSLTDLGSNATNVVANNAPVIVAGAAGDSVKAYHFIAGSSQSLSASDASLPTTTASRSYGGWLKTTNTSTQAMMGWGNTATTYDAIYTAAGVLTGRTGASVDTSGVFVADGQWHHVAVVIDNAAVDAKLKLYLDGRIVGSSNPTVNNALAGAGAFRIGSFPNATSFWTGQIGPTFVSSVALTPIQVATLYDKSSQQLTSSPKNEGEHIEGMDSTYLYIDARDLPSNSLVDIQVQG